MLEEVALRPSRTHRQAPPRWLRKARQRLSRNHRRPANSCASSGQVLRSERPTLAVRRRAARLPVTPGGALLRESASALPCGTRSRLRRAALRSDATPGRPGPPTRRRRRTAGRRSCRTVVDCGHLVTAIHRTTTSGQVLRSQWPGLATPARGAPRGRAVRSVDGSGLRERGTSELVVATSGPPLAARSAPPAAQDLAPRRARVGHSARNCWPFGGGFETGAGAFLNHRRVTRRGAGPGRGVRRT